MPPQGGRLDLSDEDMLNIATYLHSINTQVGQESSQAAAFLAWLEAGGAETVEAVEEVSREGLSGAALDGQTTYFRFCAVCHGATGLGDGPVTRRGVPPPPSFMLDNAVNMADGQMYHVITLGQNNMASYASQVSREDRWKVIRYVRTLQERPVVAATDTRAEAQP